MRWARLLFLCAWAACAQTHPVLGDWAGTIESGGATLRLALHIQEDAGRGLKGTFDSLDQGARGLALAEVTFEAGKLRFTFPAGKAHYEGRLSADGEAIEGEWTQGASLPLTFRRGPSAEPRRTQMPQGPFPYDESEVSIENPQAEGVKLACTLTAPKQNRPVPAVVLITGSGPQNRDEELLGHQPFRVLADYLGRHGIAALRCDDRGIAKSTGSFGKATTLDFATDTEAALAFLKTRLEVDPMRLGLIGHSEGGIIAPIVASRNRDVAFVVLLAGTAVNGREVLREQMPAVLRAQGQPEGMARMAIENQQRALSILDVEPDSETAFARLRLLGSEQVARALTTPWFRAFLKLEPAPYLRQMKAPVLALFGERDVQVLASQNAPAMVKAFEDGRHPNYAVVKLPRLNHLFQTATTGGPNEYGEIEESIAPLALETLTRWIQQHTLRKGK